MPPPLPGQVEGVQGSVGIAPPPPPTPPFLSFGSDLFLDRCSKFRSFSSSSPHPHPTPLTHSFFAAPLKANPAFTLRSSLYW